ncbi:MAG: TolC family protein [Gemmatimonadota bacterium]
MKPSTLGRRAVALALTTALHAAPLAAADAAPADSLRLSLRQALDLALDLNPSVQGARVATRIQARALAAEGARFGRSLTAQVSHQADRSPSISSLESVETATSSVLSTSAGISQELVSGGRLGLSFSNSRYSSNAAYRIIDPVYDSGLSLEYTQPLLQGRGAVNRTGREVARNDLAIADADLEEQVRDLTAQVSGAYWDLYFALEKLQVQRQLEEGARRVLETVRTRAEMGAEARTAILQAEVGVARRDQELVSAEGAVRQAEDQLRALLGLDRDRAQWQSRLVPTSAPELAPFDGDLGAGVEAALLSSPAFRRAEIQVQSLDLQAALARDRTRPEVNLSAQVGLTGIGGTYGDDLDGLSHADGRTWRGGLSLQVPLGQSADQERYRQRLLEKERGQIDLERLRLAIVQQVREQYRLVEINRRASEVADLVVRLARQNVAEEEQRLSLGLSTVRQVLDAQDELAQSRVASLSAVVDYNRALAEWTRLTGEER